MVQVFRQPDQQARFGIERPSPFQPDFPELGFPDVDLIPEDTAISPQEEADLDGMGERSRTSDDTPNVVSFDTPSTSTPATTLSSSPGKEDITNFLTASGASPQLVARTMAYLESKNVNMADIGELIRNQMSFDGRDIQDVIGAMQAYGTITEAMGYRIPQSTSLLDVQEGLKSGRVKVETNPDFDLGDAAGKYRFSNTNSNTRDGDTIYLNPDFRIDNTLQRSVLFHELVHAKQDIEHAEAGASRYGDRRPTFEVAETEAYMAQGIFLAHNGASYGEYLRDEETVMNAKGLKNRSEVRKADRMNLLSESVKYGIYTRRLEYYRSQPQTPENTRKVQAYEQALENLEFDIKYRVSRHPNYSGHAERRIDSDGLRTHRHDHNHDH